MSADNLMAQQYDRKFLQRLDNLMIQCINDDEMLEKATM